MKIKIYPPYDYSYLLRSDLHDFLEKNGVHVDFSENRSYLSGVLGCFGTVADCKKFIDEFRVCDGNFLVYCYEPRFDLTIDNYLEYNNCRIHVMNVYTNDVYLNIFHDFRIDHIIKLEDFLFSLKQKSINYSSNISQLASFHQWMIDQNFEFDLVSYRNKIAIVGSELPYFFLYGRSWPASVKVQGDSRAGDWVSSKKDILLNSFFNIALENTLAHNYVTEKIWDSIVHLNLPVYWGNEWISSFLDSDCYINYSSSDDPMSIIGRIVNMGKSEWIDRMELAGKKVSLIDISLINDSKMQRFSAFLQKIKSI